MAASAYDFWERIDDLRGSTTLKEICEKTGIKYTRVRDNRSEVRFLKAEDMEAFANYLGTTTSFLMFGETQKDPKDSDRISAIIEKLRIAPDLELAMVEKILGIGG